jgi:hypothetical protein
MCVTAGTGAGSACMITEGWHYRRVGVELLAQPTRLWWRSYW